MKKGRGNLMNKMVNLEAGKRSPMNGMGDEKTKDEAMRGILAGKSVKRGFSVAGVIVAVVAVAMIAGVAIIVANKNQAAVNYDNYDLYSIISGDENNGGIGDHVKKTKDGSYTGEPVYIYEYADYQCPGCASLNPKINTLIDELDGKLAVVYRNYLLSYHQNGTAAASAAEAAGLQGYWKEYADTLFTNQSEWEYATGSARTELFEKYFVSVAGNKGDLNEFRQDVASSEVSDKISFDMGIGKKINVAGTPAFYIEGQFIPWASSDGGMVEINGKQIIWDRALTGSEFMDKIKEIVEAKLGE